MLPFLLFLSALAQKLNLDLIACNEGGGAAEGGGMPGPAEWCSHFRAVFGAALDAPKGGAKHEI